MFSNTLRSVIPYAQQLEAQRIRLTLPSQSPLGSLMSYSAADNPHQAEPISHFLERISQVTVMENGLSEHDISVATLVDELAPLVQTHIRVAREIGQIATELTENVRRYVNAAPAVEASGEFNITKDEVPSLFDEASVVALIERASTAPVRLGDCNFVAGARSFETLLGYLLSGNTKLDQRVKEMVSVFDASWLENVWYGLFATGNGLSSPYNLDKFVSLPPGERLSVGYAAYVIAGKLLTDVPEDAVDSLSQFESGLADFREHLLIVMQGALSDVHHQLKNKVVAVAYRGYNRTVIVNGPVYRGWLETGGTPEILLGSLLSNNQAYTADEFAERGFEFQRQWNGYCSLHNAESDLRRSAFLRSIYLTCFTETLGKIAPFEEEFRKSNPLFAEQVISRAEVCLNATGIDTLMKLEEVALTLVAGIRFDYTPAMLILSDISRVTQASPNVDIREAALVAAANYLAQYLAGVMSASAA